MKVYKFRGLMLNKQDLLRIFIIRANNEKKAWDILKKKLEYPANDLPTFKLVEQKWVGENEVIEEYLQRT